MKYKSYRIVDGKPRWVIVDDNGKISNNNPLKGELKDLEIEPVNLKGGTICRDEDLLNCLKIFYEKNGRIPATRDFHNSHIYPSYNTYRDHFGSWNNALILANLGIREKNLKIYTDEELLNYLKIFYDKNGRIPTHRDFKGDYKYPDTSIYYRRFGSFEKAKKLVEMDIDTIARKGYLTNNIYKGRSWEIMVVEMFDNKGIDLSGDNCNSTIDGICPTGQTYEVKSSKFYKLKVGGYWLFGTQNNDKQDDKEAIQWYYLGAFNEDYTELLYVWRVPGEIIEEHRFYVGMINAKFNINNMEIYNITEKFKDMVIKRNTI